MKSANLFYLTCGCCLLFQVLEVGLGLSGLETHVTEQGPSWPAPGWVVGWCPGLMMLPWASHWAFVLSSWPGWQWALTLLWLPGVLPNREVFTGSCICHCPSLATAKQWGKKKKMAIMAIICHRPFSWAVIFTATCFIITWGSYWDQLVCRWETETLSRKRRWL